ncbi:MAG: hypothetical protein P8X86_07835 [Desulfofustis sp.]
MQILLDRQLVIGHPANFLFRGLLVSLLFLLCFAALFIKSGCANEAPPLKTPPAAVPPPVISGEARPVEEIREERFTGIPILSEEQGQTLDKRSTQGDDIPYLSPESQAQLDDLQKKGSALVLSAAEWIDSFFDDPRYLAEENRTRAKVKIGLGYSELYDVETYGAIDLRVNLPRLEKRANVFLRLNDDSDFDADSSPIPNTEGGSKNDREQLTAGVQYFLAMGEQYNLSTEVGASLNYLFAGLRYRHLHSLSDDGWSGRFTNRLRYYTDDGWENKASYDIEKFFGQRFMSRSILTAILSESREGMPFSAVTRLYQVFNIDSAIAYDVGGYFDTEPDLEFTDFQIKLRYRQRFFRDWLVLEVAPLVTFPKEYDHQFNPGILTRFEIDFGYLQDQEAYESIFKF